ncbi:Het-C-domain-containing protein [Dothidotthia symphoricarpi CBS 119687]|uniref:Het-C-domain-containing protein n=1 Tax=Dothidotthia symphoricarpi CBS 119687 TaxID=1392245 RepID=A0A6A6AL76_9PLEO|nr:Het-C-domain-containing protein [Dothidotthia symphoricarpi CBS 119687]KAF2131684.1 Het-C-domain-containing protein [Dothidotthia symphoricarpi CBS 119687]
MAISSNHLLLVAIAILVLLPSAEAFGAGNIASISKIEGKNWRHGDIEDMLATVACLQGHKWKATMIKRVYFGNWLRDYSQAVDVGTVAKVQSETIRLLVWILSFMSFGYATGEFEVTAERLGVYRPEEHIDNPKDYADGQDARKFDPRLRSPVLDIELAVDPNTGMKNYIANEQGGWSTSTGYAKYSFARAIHFGRLYTHGPSGQRGREEDLSEALRCLGQGLHCLEDYGAHTNYTELVLRELGYTNVFPHVGTQTAINLRGQHVFPLVTGTFGGVDFFHSVLGEATDHITSAEIDQMDTTLSDALMTNKKGGGDTCTALTDALKKIPGTGGLIQQAQSLQAASDAQAASNTQHGLRSGGPAFDAPPGFTNGPPGPDIPGTNTDPATIIPKIYPILVFRDNVVRSISAIVSKIPGLEKAIESITERVTLFVMSLLAPFVLPVIKTASAQLKSGSSAVVEAAAKHQFDVWTNPMSTDPTHSMLSKDHFSNILNEPAGQVAVAILQYVAPRVIYAWDHPDVPVDQVLDDCMRVFHHPALRDPRCEVHNTMFEVVKKWAHNYHGKDLNDVLSSDSVKAGRNHSGSNDHSHGAHAHGAANAQSFQGGGNYGGQGGGNQHSSSNSGGGLFGSLGNVISPALNKFSTSRDDVGLDPSSSSVPYQPSHSPQPAQWGSFQPYQSSYAGEGYQAPAEHNTAAPAGGYGWGQGQYSGGQGDAPAYSVPTAYQQGYEGYGTGPGGYEQPPHQQPPAGGYSTYDQGSSGGSGRQWGAGGGNSGW